MTDYPTENLYENSCRLFDDNLSVKLLGLNCLPYDSGFDIFWNVSNFMLFSISSKPNVCSTALDIISTVY